MGDSITDAYNAPGGYRVGLFRAARRAGYHLKFVGSKRNGPARVDGAIFPKEHEGHSGFTIDDAPRFDRPGITRLARAAVQRFDPDIVLLMIGTNDISVNHDLAAAPERLGKLVDRILEVDPNLFLIVAQIPPTQSDKLNALVARFNSRIPKLVLGKRNANYNVHHADMFSAFTRDKNYKAALLEDTLHPNEAGYHRIAGTWYSVLEPRLAGSPNQNDPPSIDELRQ